MYKNSTSCSNIIIYLRENDQLYSKYPIVLEQDKEEDWDVVNTMQWIRFHYHRSNYLEISTLQPYKQATLRFCKYGNPIRSVSAKKPAPTLVIELSTTKRACSSSLERSRDFRHSLIGTISNTCKIRFNPWSSSCLATNL